MDHNTPLLRPKSRSDNSLLVSVQFMTDKGSTPPIIYPGHRFSLEVFIFNKSANTRNLEVGFVEHLQNSVCPVQTPVVPLENNVRVGPLDPETCQTVRLRLLALEPGMHTIDNLTVTDIDSGRKMTLRAAVDVVILDPTKSSN